MHCLQLMHAMLSVSSSTHARSTLCRPKLHGCACACACARDLTHRQGWRQTICVQCTSVPFAYTAVLHVTSSYVQQRFTTAAAHQLYIAPACT